MGCFLILLLRLNGLALFNEIHTFCAGKISYVDEILWRRAILSRPLDSLDINELLQYIYKEGLAGSLRVPLCSSYGVLNDSAWPFSIFSTATL